MRRSCRLRARRPPRAADKHGHRGRAVAAGTKGCPSPDPRRPGRWRANKSVSVSRHGAALTRFEDQRGGCGTGASALQLRHPRCEFSASAVRGARAARERNALATQIPPVRTGFFCLAVQSVLRFHSPATRPRPRRHVSRGASPSVRGGCRSERTLLNRTWTGTSRRWHGRDTHFRTDDAHRTRENDEAGGSQETGESP